MQTQRQPWIRLLIIGYAVTGVAACGSAKDTEPPVTVASVDLERYLGTWYEIAKIPNRFQDQCVGDTTAEYRRGDNGQLQVINRCRTADGSIDEAHGIARVADPLSTAKLEVSFVRVFGWHLFWGDYWVLDLAPDYHYVVVGEPGREFGWILSRTPTLPAEVRSQIDRGLKGQGYDPLRFEDTEQDLAPPRN